MGDYARELEVARALARAAAVPVLEVYATDFEVWMKSGREPVTEADRAASRLIVEGLREAFPGDVVLSEEEVAAEGASAATARAAAPRVWLVDPVDGTKEFVARNGEFSVMIGLAVAGEAVVGAVYLPTSGRLFSGAKGAGAFDGQRAMRVSAERDPRRARLVVSRSHRNALVDRLKQELGIVAETASGSVGIKAGLIAAGEADLYVNPSSKSRLWDGCAPDAILRAAGGLMTDIDGRPLDYAGRSLYNERGIIASNGGALHEAALQAARLLQEKMP
jgi:3'(2'), 5'-bisphosphate nucleotidase